MNNPRHPICTNRNANAADARIDPIAYPSCKMPEKMPRPSLGSVSKVNAAPTPHSPPIAIPNNARKTSSAFSDGAKAQASSITEKLRILNISTGRRP